MGNMGGFKHICRMKKRVYCTVTNDLNYDQRMIRICTSLANAGYTVNPGRPGRRGVPCRWQRGHSGSTGLECGPAGVNYSTWNTISGFFFTCSRKKMDGICAIDLDSVSFPFAILFPGCGAFPGSMMPMNCSVKCRKSLPGLLSIKYGRRWNAMRCRLFAMAIP